MVDAVPGLPGVVDALPVYRGDPFAQVFQFVDQDTTDWVMNAQARRSPDSTTVLAEIEVEVNFEGDPELVQISFDEEVSALLPPRCVSWDLERESPGERRTMLKGTFDVDPDVTRVEVGS